MGSSSSSCYSCAPAHACCSGVSVRRPGCVCKRAILTLRTAKRLQNLPLSLLKFIACGFGLVFSFWHDTNFFFFVVNERMRWNTFCQENVGADCGIRANHSVAAHDRGSGVNADAVFDRWVALFSTQRLSSPERASDEGHALVK